MFLYNVTTQVDGAIAEQWLQWMKEEHIPEVVATGCFTSARVWKLVEVDETEGPTFAVQYLAGSKADYNRYITIHAQALRQKSYQKWGDRFIAFRSVMQEM